MSTHPPHPFFWSQTDPRSRPFRPMRIPNHQTPSYPYHHRAMPSAAPLNRHISPTPSQYPLIYSDASSPYAPHMPTSASGAAPAGDQLLEYYDPMGDMEPSMSAGPYDGYFESSIMGWNDNKKASGHELSHEEKMRLVASAASPNASFSHGGMSPPHVKLEHPRSPFYTAPMAEPEFYFPTAPQHSPHMSFSAAGAASVSSSNLSPPPSMMASPQTFFFPSPPHSGSDPDLDVDMTLAYPQDQSPPGVAPSSLEAAPMTFIRPADLTPSPTLSHQYASQISPSLGSSSGSSPNSSSHQSQDQVQQNLRFAALPPSSIEFPSAHTYGSSSPPGLTGESDYDDGSESGESEAEEMDPDDDDFVPRSRNTTRRRRTSSTSGSTSGGYNVSHEDGSLRRVTRASKLTAPVPVPNLTKKSRGRRVPTAPVFVNHGGVQKNVRTYTCHVDDCGKCFARGEHLKRHVRSIHTNEKPHKCPVAGCGKDFSRHDNLGQHMRVHKGYVLGEDY